PPATLMLGLAAGFLVGIAYGPEKTAALGVDSVPGPDTGYIPIDPNGSPLEQDQPIIVLSPAPGSLTIEDLASVGETVLPRASALEGSSGLDGLCGIVSSPEAVPFPQGPGVGYGVLRSLAFRLVDATVRERIGPDLDVLAASTLRGTVELARSCRNGEGLTVQTEGIAAGIGDEYATFRVSRLNPASGLVETSIVVLVRVGGQLIEIALSPEGAVAVPDGMARALRIAGVAVSRMLAG
ncbi:MAG: hypothetical protein M3313_08750, partial [Actinomycetota bacterium]|nr:hypothetical protein [Actinomycetota bacterium]